MMHDTFGKVLAVPTLRRLVEELPDNAIVFPNALNDLVIYEPVPGDAPGVLRIWGWLRFDPEEIVQWEDA